MPRPSRAPAAPALPLRVAVAALLAAAVALGGIACSSDDAADAPDANGPADAAAPANDATLGPTPSDGAAAPEDATTIADAIADAMAPDADADADAPPRVPEDFHVPGTQIGDVPPGTLIPPSTCAWCHAGAEIPNAPHPTWSGSLMANAGRDPLFFAQLATANQDVPGVGTYCVRCHVPTSVVSGAVASGTEAALGDSDRDGVTCHFCHAMVDPLAKPDASPPGDPAIVASLADPPAHFGNAAFVIDPSGMRRGPYDQSQALHPVVSSTFLRRGDFCGTCHDVGNLALSKMPDGTYRANAPDARAPDADPRAQFPLERTFTEWSLSAYANGGVDAGGRFGGDAGSPTVSTCQDCHMPRVAAAGCAFADPRADLARHDFAGASSWVLEIIAQQYGASVDQGALAAGQVNAIAMLRRAATLTAGADASALHVRVTNESGHKIPTGHIEGRRIWVGVVFTDASGAVLREAGRWDPATGDLDEGSTTVFEMRIGLSPAWAQTLGLPAGETTHMSLADVIVKDDRIPPRGFANAAYEAAGAGVVGATYADGQHWADVDFARPAGATAAKVTLWYQTVSRAYVEALANGNHTDAWGKTLASLWQATGKGAPVAMAEATIALP